LKISGAVLRCNCSHEQVAFAEKASLIGDDDYRNQDRTVTAGKSLRAPGVEPVFPEKDHAIDYAQNRACFRSSEIRVLDSCGAVAPSFHLVRRIEDCDGHNIARRKPPNARLLGFWRGR